MARFFAILIVVALIIGGIYFAVDKDNLSQYTFPEFDGKKVLKSVFQRAKEGNLDAGISLKTDSIIGEGDNFFTKAIEGVESVVDSVIDDIKLETFKKFKDAVNKKVDDLGKNAGVDVDINVNTGGGSAASRSADPVVFTMKSQDPAYFTVVNREDKNIEYEVDWQDGNKDSGTLDEDERAILSHKWSKPGEYLIQFKIIKIGEEDNYQFLINIF